MKNIVMLMWDDIINNHSFDKFEDDEEKNAALCWFATGMSEAAKIFGDSDIVRVAPEAGHLSSLIRKHTYNVLDKISKGEAKNDSPNR